jgi:hypothetical protein
MSKQPRLVYIAGPYTHSDSADNVRAAILAGLDIFQAGHTPFIPHLYHFAHMVYPMSYERWMLLDLRWLQICHVVLRLPGDSPGADREVDFAKQLGMPIYFTLADCVRDLPKLSVLDCP